MVVSRTSSAVAVFGIVLCLVPTVHALFGVEEDFGEFPLGEDPTSFLEEQMELQGSRQCRFVGDLHFVSSLSDTPGGNYNVMGEEEWLMMQSKAGPDGRPFFEMQGTQVAFQTENRNHGQWSQFYCKRRFPHITIMKDVAFKCGSNYFLYQAPRGTYNAWNCPNDNAIHPDTDYTGFYVKGNLQGIGNVDYEYFTPNLNTWYTFNDGDGKFLVERACCQNGCGKQNNRMCGRPGRFKFQCAESETTVDVYTCCSGCAYTNAWVNVPDSGQATTAKIADTTMMGGLCGGFDQSTKGRQLKQDHADCRNTNNVAGTFWFAGPDHGVPGKEGTWHVGHQRWSWFYTTHKCRNDFIARDTNSIFRLFEMNMKGKNRAYDSARWSPEGTSEKAHDDLAQDIEKWNKSVKECVDFRKSVDNREDSQLSGTATKDVLLKSASDECTEDTYLDMPWTEEEMKETVCESFQGQLDYERMDIHCAHDGYMGVDVDDSAIAQCGVNQNTDQQLADKVDIIEAYMDEVEESQQNVDFWDDGACDFVNSDFEELQLDCNTHAFHNTKLLKDGKVVTPKAED